MAILSKLMNLKTWMFVGAAYLSYMAGGWIVDWMAVNFSMLSFLFTGLLGDIVKFSIPTLILYFWYLRGKG